MRSAFAWLTPDWIRARQYHLLAPLVALAVVALFEQWWVAELLEDQTVNMRFRARQQFDPPADSRLIFVAIDEYSLSSFGKWPWPRTVEADFLNTIASSDTLPRTVSFDIMFTDAGYASNGAASPDDMALGEAVSLLPSVITGALTFPKPDDPATLLLDMKRTDEALATIGPTQSLPNVIGNPKDIPGSDVADFPVTPVRTQSLFGFVNDNPSPIDDIRHTLPLIQRVRDKVYPSLALQTLCQMLSVDADKVEVNLPARVIRLTDLSKKVWTIPTNEHGEYFINYRAEGKYQRVSLAALTQNLGNHVKNHVPLAKDCPDITNKTLLIGESATALGDMGPSPLASRSPLPYAHLNVINNVLQHDYLKFVPWYWVVLGWLVATWITLLRLKVAPLVEAVGAPIAAVVVYIAIAFGIFWAWSIQIALAWPVLAYGAVNFGGVVLRWREEQKGRQALKATFSQMLSPEILNHLLQHPESLKLGGSDRASTILFSDIRDYTKFSEGKSAAEVMGQLNVYFERMVNCVFECKGSLHKFIGDAVMAAWGDIPEASRGPAVDAQNAVRSALLMRRRLRELNVEREEQGLTPIRIGIGLNHGVVQAGMLGSEAKKEFTVIGDEVNVASRLEGITKEFKTDLAVSETVRRLLGDAFLVRRLGAIQLKGKTKATVVYEVLAEKSQELQSKMKPEIVARYEEAFDHFLARRFGKSADGFEACLKNYPEDYCSKIYLAASREYLVTPPPEDWDGRIVMTTK